MNKNIYVCTSYNDIQYILSHVFASDNTSIVIVFNHKGIFNFFSNLKYDKLELKYFSNQLLDIYSIRMWYNEMKEIFKIYSFSKKQSNSSVYTISLYFDLQSLMLLRLLHKKNKIFIFSSKDLVSNFTIRKNDFKTYFWSIIYQTKLQKYTTYNTSTLGLSKKWIDKYITEYNITQIPLLDKNIDNYRFLPPTDECFVLLLFSAEEEREMGESQLKNIISFLNIKFSNLKFVYKGHPRIGIPKVFSDFNYFEIDKHQPIELLDLRNCKKVFGIGSLALANISNSNIEVFSLIHFLPNNLIEYKKNTIDYLLAHSKSIKFPENLNQIY